MIHVTCLANRLHRVAEVVRFFYPNVDTLLSSGKQIFRKSHSRVAEFCKQAPRIPQQAPITTRWNNF